MAIWGPESHRLLSNSLLYIMRVLLLILLVVLVVEVVEGAKKKPSKKPSKKPAKKPSKPKPPSCPADKVNPKKFAKFTVMVKGKPVLGQPCWWDLSRSDCAKCKKGGKQCGFPMHQYCQASKSKIGCAGIQNYKWTLSSLGYPCFDNPKSLECAWCATNQAQCQESTASKKCGSFCKPLKDQVCDGVLTTCNNIPKCGLAANCDKKSGKCVCKKGFSGNGYQCTDNETGLPAANPAGEVEVSIETDSKFFVYPQGSSLFSEL